LQIGLPNVATVPHNKGKDCINWEDFRPILETIYDKERKSHAGRKPTDVMVMFKMLILHVCHQ
jgi:IS5 family transposase